MSCDAHASVGPRPRRGVRGAPKVGTLRAQQQQLSSCAALGTYIHTLFWESMRTCLRTCVCRFDAMPLTLCPSRLAWGACMHAARRGGAGGACRVGGCFRAAAQLQRACMRVCTSMRASDREIANAGDDMGNARRLCTAQTRGRRAFINTAR